MLKKRMGWRKWWSMMGECKGDDSRSGLDVDNKSHSFDGVGGLQDNSHERIFVYSETIGGRQR